MNVKLINCLKIFRDTFPPYGLGVLNAFLNNHSIKSDIFDLDIVIKHQNSLSKKSSSVNLHYLRDNYESVYSILKQNKFDSYFDIQFERMLERIDFNGVDVVGINSHDNEAYIPLYLAKKIKEKTGCTVVIGGSHIKRISYERLRYIIRDVGINYVDYFVSDHPYDFFIRLEGDKMPKHHRKATILKDEKTIVDMNDYEVPIYNEEHLELYKIDARKMKFFCYKVNDEMLSKFKVLQETKNVKPLLVLPYKFMEGCTNNCSFCCFNREGNTFKLDEDVVLSNIKAMMKKYHCKNFYFLNNNITMDKEYALSLFKKMSNEVDINWCDCASINNLDANTIRLMADSGCIQLLFGLESASSKLLRYVNKNSGCDKVKSYTKCFNECDKNNIWVLVDLIAGLPYETDTDIQCTVNYLKRNRRIINGVFVNRFALMKRSAFFNNPERFKLRLIKDSYVQGRMTLESGREFDVYHKLYYRTGVFSEKEGLGWEEKQDQISNSSKILKDYVNKWFKVNFYSYYPIFLLYDIFDNKKLMTEFLDSKRRLYRCD